MSLLGNILEPNPQGGLLDFAMNLAQAGGAGKPTMAGLAGAVQQTRRDMVAAREYERERRMAALQDKALEDMTDADLREAFLVGGPQAYAALVAAKMRGRYGGENTPDYVQEYEYAQREYLARGGDPATMPKELTSYPEYVRFRRESLGTSPILMQMPGGGWTGLQVGSQGTTKSTPLGSAPGQFSPEVQAAIKAEEKRRTDIEAKRSAQPQAKNSLIQTQSAIDRSISQIDNAVPGIDWTTSGLVGSFLAKFPGTSATNLQAKLQPVIANQAFSTLQEMRNNNPTGGALGAIAVPELELLAQSVESLRQAQSPAALVEAMRDYRRALVDARRRLGEGYTRVYGEFEKEGEAPTPRSPGQADIGAPQKGSVVAPVKDITATPEGTQKQWRGINLVVKNGQWVVE